MKEKFSDYESVRFLNEAGEFLFTVKEYCDIGVIGEE